MPFLANDDVVMHRHAQRLCHRDDRLRHRDVGLAGRGVARRMIVEQDNMLAVRRISLEFRVGAARRGTEEIGSG